MATSDSEDFESADEELDVQIDKLKDENCSQVKPKIERETDIAVIRNLEPGNGTAIRSNLESKLDISEHPSVELETDTTVKSKSPNSENICTEKEVDNIVKSLERDFRIDDSKSPDEARSNSDKLSVEKCEDKKVSETEIQELEYSNTVLKNDYKSINHDNNESLGTESKHVKMDPIEKNNPSASALEIDGWDCEDEDLDDLVEESSCKPSDIAEEGSIKLCDPVGRSGKPDDEKSNNKHDMDSVLDKLSKSVEQQEKQSSDGGASSGWGGWGVTSLLWTAAESVSTLSNQVSQGLSTVLETGLGVPDPEELVKQEKEEENKLLTSLKEGQVESPKEEKESTGLMGLGHVISGVSSITKLVENASTKVVSGGLDTLETIGKKTMEVLQEGDPGLRKKRAIFSEKVVLSQILREAKEKGEQEDRVVRNSEEARKVHFETLFDDYHGLVHLEALEMLSKQCNIKLQSVLLNTPPSDLPELQKSIAEIKDLCELPDEDDSEGESFESLESKLADVGKGLGVPVANEKLIKTWQEIHQWIQNSRSNETSTDDGSGDTIECSVPSVQEIHQKAIGTLARLTAEAVEQFHKTAELLLVYEKRNPYEEAKILLDMTTVFSLQVSTAATAFSVNLNTSPEYAANSDGINSQITNVFLEAANSSSYIQEAFQLLVPVLQVGIVST